LLLSVVLGFLQSGSYTVFQGVFPVTDNTADELMKKIEALRKKVRSLPKGADLGGLLDEECPEFARLLRQNLTDEREDAASKEADFSP
jgi:hypothetical protein